ncbi:MAG: mechanosensitive ion channel [Clostridia bacterium]|nr:mechanosensitive ion channel [Clostridia bacterium]
MKKRGTLQKKTAWAVAVMLVSILIITFALTGLGMRFTRNREQTRNRQKLNALSQMLTNENAIKAAAVESYDAHITSTLRLMTDALAALFDGTRYTGPRVFSDGLVAQLSGERVVLPEDMPFDGLALDAAELRQSLRTGGVRAATAEIDGEMCFLSFAEIGRGLVYVDITPEQEYLDYIGLYTAQIYEALEKADNVFDGATLVIGEQDGQRTLLRTYGDVDDGLTLADLGLSSGEIPTGEFEVSLGGKTYTCAVLQPEAEWRDRSDVTVLQMLPLQAQQQENLRAALFIAFTVALILATVITYVTSVQRYVMENEITGDQAAHYAPRRMRIKLIYAGIIGVVAIFAITLVVQEVKELYVLLRHGQNTLSLLSRQIERMDDDRDEGIVRDHEDWYVYYGQRMAELLSEYPQLATRETLQTFCDDLDIDYIVMFDENGNQQLCSRDYSGLTMSRGLGQDASDFQRLLLGVPSIVHKPSVNSATGLERQRIGVKLPAADGRYGALIMALMPEKTSINVDINNIDKEISLIATDGTMCFTADQATGAILYANDPEMVGNNIVERELAQESLRDGYMDFVSLGGARHFVVTDREDELILYYAVRYGDIFEMVIQYGLVAAGLFALALGLLLAVLFHGYNDITFSEWAVINTPEDPDGEPGGQRVMKEATKADIRRRVVTEGHSASAWEKLLRAIRWREKLPEEKSNAVFQSSLFLLMLFWANGLFSGNLAHDNYDSLAAFLVRGNWMRGVNLFAFCSIMLVVGYTIMINVATRFLMGLTSGFLMRKGQTICRLVESFIRYISLIMVLYMTLNYLGLPVGTVVGSLGIASLALSLGAKDLAADIVAGLFIVFERTFQVGDVVEINGKHGKVQEIGVRSTKLMLPGNNMLVMGNHCIEEVLNLTCKLSWCSVELRVPAKASLQKIEEALKRELPKIGKRCDKIVGQLNYVGVTELGGDIGTYMGVPTRTLTVSAECREEDKYTVRLFIIRELCLLFEREGIELM